MSFDFIEFNRWSFSQTFINNKHNRIKKCTSMYFTLSNNSRSPWHLGKKQIFKYKTKMLQKKPYTPRIRIYYLIISWRLSRGLWSSISSIHVYIPYKLPYFINIAAKSKDHNVTQHVLYIHMHTFHVKFTYYTCYLATVASGSPNLSNTNPLHAERKKPQRNFLWKQQ